MTPSVRARERMRDLVMSLYPIASDRGIRRQLARAVRRFQRRDRVKLERDARRFGWIDLGGEG